MILQPAKVATPATALLGFVVQMRVAPAGVVMVSMTDLVLVVFVFPPASWPVTPGWVAKALFAAVLRGGGVKASAAAAGVERGEGRVQRPTPLDGGRGVAACHSGFDLREGGRARGLLGAVVRAHARRVRRAARKTLSAARSASL